MGRRRESGPGAPPYLAAGRAPANADQEGLAAVGLLVVLQGLLAVPSHGSRRPSSRCLCERTHAPRPRRAPSASRSLRWALPRSRLTRLPAHRSDPGAGAGFPEGAESLPLPAVAAPVYIPGRGQRDAAAPIRADSALLFAEAAAARRLPQPPPLPGPAAAAWGLWERYEPDPSPNPPG